jgi:phosphatidylcholine synthase
MQKVERPLLRYRSRFGMADREESIGTGARAAAWAVHLFTASGVVLALLALAALDGGDEHQALLWLVAAIVIDGVDGTFARAAHVKTRLPRIDGDALDLVIDYLTFVFIPAMLIWRGNYLPQSLALPLTALILLSSLYVFARRDMKTDDGYFRGFPALWVLVAFYFVLVPMTPAVRVAVVVALVALTFAPILVIHPFRARDFGPWPIIFTMIAGAAMFALLVPGWTAQVEKALILASVAAVVILFVLGMVRTLRGPKLQ